MTMDIETVSCPVCGPAPSSIFWKSAGLTRYVRCSSCGLVYASPRISHNVRYTWLENNFTVNEGLLSQSHGRLSALQLEADFIRKYISPGRLLDIGCSTGALFSFFALQGWELHGVELVESAAQFARSKFHASVYCGILKDAAYPHGFFDVVSIIDTFYYVDDPVAELNEVSRITQPGGHVAIEIAGQAYALWRNYGWAPRLLDGRATRADSDSSYLYWFNYRSLELLLQKTGFEVRAALVVPSPQNVSSLMRAFTCFHYFAASNLSKLSTRFFDWSPKWMVLARKKDHS